MWYHADRSSSVALHLLSKSSLKIFGVKEWSVLNLMTSKRFLFFFFPLVFFSNMWIKAFPSEKVMITTQICFYPPFFPLEEGNIQTSDRAARMWRHDVKERRKARQCYSGIIQNRFSACEQICPRGKRQLTNYVWAKWLPFGLRYQLCR